MNVLELYSGIGGMHLALKKSKIFNWKIEASIEINPIANEIYKYNFPETLNLNKNIKSLDDTFIKNLGVNTILMSPPCQPFTKNGLEKDIDDSRNDSFLHLIHLLHKLETVDRILIENVQAFESSQMRNILINELKNCGFHYKEIILSPAQFGIPNSRRRYYCLARRIKLDCDLELNLPFNNECFPIESILEETGDYCLLNDKILMKYHKLLDICHRKSTNTCCFTKAYSRYIEGTGSVFTPKSPEKIQQVFQKPDAILDSLKSLELRFFTPREVCRLMSFPEEFKFPSIITDRQKYKVLGNSINVKVVSELLNFL